METPLVRRFKKTTPSPSVPRYAGLLSPFSSVALHPLSQSLHFAASQLLGPPMCHREKGPTQNCRMKAYPRYRCIQSSLNLTRYRIISESYETLNNLAAALKTLSHFRFDINGYSDATELPVYNMELSLLRAGSVFKYLVDQGVPRDRLRPRGFGSLHPVDSRHPSAPINRRVEIVNRREF